MINDNLEKYMQSACDMMLKSEGDIKVGCVLVKDDIIISYGYKTKTQHAERMAIENAIKDGIDLKNSILFTTLEPCIKIRSNQEKESCCELIDKYKIKTVYIGSYDPNPVIHRKGWSFLKEKNIERKEFRENFTNQISDNNKIFSDYFYESKGNDGTGKVNHQHTGRFKVIAINNSQNEVSFNIEWSVCGPNLAYVYGPKAAHAMYCSNFDEIENCSMYHFNSSVQLPLNEIAILDYFTAFILVKPIEIQSGPRFGDEHYFVKFKYLVRFK